MATVTTNGRTEKARHVKNLGWLLRHWREVDRIKVRHNSLGKSTHGLPYYMTVYLTRGNDKLVYETDWASAIVMWDWLHRPSLRGVPLDWFGEQTVC